MLVYPEHEAVVEHWAGRNRLAIVFGTSRIDEHVEAEGKGAWSNMGAISEDPAAARYAYVGRRIDDAIAARTAQESSPTDHRALGQLLAIPPCCTEHYIEHRTEAVGSYADDYAFLTTRNTPNAGSTVHDWRSNYLGQYFGFSLIHHFPCRWDCSATRARAEQSAELIGEVSPAWLDLFARRMRGTVIIENRRAIHMLQAVDQRPIRGFAGRSFLSTTVTPLAAAVLTRRRLDWSDRGEPLVTGWSPDVETLCLSFG